MSDIKKQSFVKGAMILVVANAISKILGAVFKIPITYILKEEGMAIFNSTMQVYIMVLMLVLSGAPVAISKMVAENLALGRKGNVHKIMRVAEFLLAVCGLIGSIVLFFGAEFFAYAMHDEKIVLAVRVIAPSVFFVALGLAYKGYYQGTQNMIPTAVSQVTESVIKLIAGYAFAMYLINYNVQTASAGATFGITVGEIIATFILLVMYLPDKWKSKNGDTKSENRRKILKDILKIAVPLTLAASVSSMLSVVDISMIRSRLQVVEFTAETVQIFLNQYSGFTYVFDDIGNTLRISEEGARWLYGAYSGYALTILHLPPGIVGTLGVSILPVIAGAYAVGDIKKISSSVQLALRIAILAALPCAVGMLLLSEPILELLFRNTASAELLTVAAPSVVMICIAGITSAVLQATGDVTVPFRNMLIGSAVKLATIYVLVARSEFNIMGAPISTNLDYLTVSVLNLYAIKKSMNISYDVKAVFVKPVMASAIMGTVVWLLREPVDIIMMGEPVGVLVVIAAGALAYAMALVLVGAIEMREIKGLFKRL